MKHKPQSLTFRTVSLIAAVIAATAVLPCTMRLMAALQDDTPASSADASEKTPASVESSLTPKEVLDGVRDTLDKLDSLTCDLYQSIILSGQRTYAVGRYIQASGNRLHLDYKLYPSRPVSADDPIAFGINGNPEETAKLKASGSLTQVSDGSVLLTLWLNGPTQRLTRRNIRDILEAVEDEPNYEKSQVLQDLGAGGMQTLVARLQSGMEFSKVREQEIGGTRYLILGGRWTTTALKDYFGLEDENALLPPNIPDFVRVYVDADAMLPRRIQYLKKHPDAQDKRVRPMVTLDFRNVALNEAIPDDVFTFEAPTGVTEEDLTKQVIEGIKQIANPKKEAENPEASSDSKTNAE